MTILNMILTKNKKFIFISNKTSKFTNYLYSSQCFDKILIANRGEIACRIIKTAKKMGIKTVAVFSEADFKSKHVKLSDESICIGPALARDSYLNINKIVQAVKMTNSRAVHPGYGFLSENSEFVKILDNNDIKFIGPSAEVINKMGDKLQSKKIAKLAGVQIIPGYDDIIKNEEECIKIAKDIGFPVMIKASAGGGGKGMRIAWNESEIRDNFKLSTQEALSSFGDGRIIVEKYIKKPRHIEIQVLGDKFGNIIHLGERECSIQRRNQKIIEEAPSTLLDKNLRDKMCNEAIMLCKRLNYTSAGTVEFLVDENRNHYFLEMNTRLQVEHPVTEYITNVDLVEEMIKIAAGNKLTMQQSDIKFNGWSIESRIYAEDPYKNFGMPSTGKLFKYFEPQNLDNVRFDSGVQAGSEINVFYDPLLCKLITYGKSRSKAIEQNLLALDSYIIQGVTTNVSLLRDILTENKFINGDLSTNYLSETYPEGFKGVKLTNLERVQLISVAALLYILTNNRNINKNIYFETIVTFDKQEYIVLLQQCDEKLIIQINGNNYEIQNEINLADPLIKIKINNKNCVFQLFDRTPNGDFKIMCRGSIFELHVIWKNLSKYTKYLKNKPKIDTWKFIKSPMPGLIKKINCKKGDHVYLGQEICVIEAMKMQNCIVSPNNGVIKTVKVKENEVIGENDVLIEFE